jgi:hypothetical protein
MKPFRRRGDICVEIKRFVGDMLQIARKKVIIRSGPIMPYLPPEYDHLVERCGRNYVVYRAENCRSNSALCESSTLAPGCKS